MQAVLQNDNAQANKKKLYGNLTISAEVVAYVAIILLSLLLRLAEIDNVPLTDGEASHALAAWRAVRLDAAGDIPLTTSPLLFALQSVSFGLVGASETSARFMTILGGVLLVLTPQLFRSYFGSSRTFIITLLLAISPVIFAGSRFSFPAIWSAIVATIMIWALWRFSLTRHAREGIIAIVAAVALLTLIESGGVVLFVIIAVAASLTSFFTNRALVAYKYELEDESEQAPAPTISLAALLRELPWGIGLPVAVFVVIIVTTAFMTNLSGLSNVGELFAGVLRGFSVHYEGATTAFPFVVALFYEPFLLGFAFVGAWLMVQRDSFDFEARFLIAWIVLAFAMAVMFVGASPDHALWFILPAAVLASQPIAELFALESRQTPFQVPVWARWLVSLIVLAIIFIFTLAFQDVARSMLNLNANMDVIRIILMLVPIIFMVITYFLVASSWNERTAMQGIGLGVLSFMIITSVGTGWRISVDRSEAPAELWHTQAYSRNLFLLRDTLLELGLRESSGFTGVGITALVPQDGAVAWLLRDFNNTQFITDLSEARTKPIVILPASIDPNNEPDLGGSYVGQSFIVSREWSYNALMINEIPAWWSQLRTRINETAIEHAVLWVRLDIYHGVDLGGG